MAAMRAILALTVLQQVLLPAGAFLAGTLSTRSAPGAAARLIARAQGLSSGARTGVAGLRASLSSALLEGRPAPRWGGELAAEAQACAAVLQVCSVSPAHRRAPPGSCRVLTPLVLRADGLASVPQSFLQDENGRRVLGQGDVRRRRAGGYERDQSGRQVVSWSPARAVGPPGDNRIGADGWAFPCAALLSPPQTLRSRQSWRKSSKSYFRTTGSWERKMRRICARTLRSEL